MRTIVQNFFRSRYTRASNWITAQYHSALRLAGLEDNDTNRVMAGIVLCVALWYACTFIDAVCRLLHETASITALVTQ